MNYYTFYHIQILLGYNQFVYNFQFPEIKFNKHWNVHQKTLQTSWLVMTLLSWDNQSIWAMAFSSGRRLSSPRWRSVCLGFICIGFCIRCCMHPDSTDSKQRGRARSDTTVLPHHSKYGYIQLRGNDEAVFEQCLDAFFSELAVGGSDIPGGEGVRGCVCVCVTSHLLLNPISKAWGLNQPSPLKACQGKAHK